MKVNFNIHFITFSLLFLMLACNESPKNNSAVDNKKKLEEVNAKPTKERKETRPNQSIPDDTAKPTLKKSSTKPLKKTEPKKLIEQKPVDNTSKPQQIKEITTKSSTEKSDSLLDPNILINNPRTKSNTEASGAKWPTMEFSKTEFDFGEIKQGEQASFDFLFSNNGSKPLVISEVTASCGCTVPSYPRHAIKPEFGSAIKVVFNSEGKSGPQKSTVTVRANTKKQENILTITGNVID